MLNANLYKYHYSLPPSGPGNYRRNGVYHVVTAGVVAAAKLCEEANKDCTIWNVQHCGKVQHIDPEILGAA